MSRRDSISLDSPPQKDSGTEWLLDGLVPDLATRADVFRVYSNQVDPAIDQAFRDHMSTSMAGLRTALDQSDVAAIRRHAHSLHGMGGMVGAPEISVVGEELSASAKQNDLSRCRLLVEALEQWLTGHPNRATADSSLPCPDSFDRMNLDGTLLIVDDELPNRLYLRALLEPYGATIIEAENGMDALEAARKDPPDLALVDVMMPGLSGYEVCEALVNEPSTSHVAVIMVTARTTGEDVEHAFEKGAFDYIRKPFHARELLARVRNALQLKRQGDELRQWQVRMTREMDAAGALQRKLLITDPLFTEDMDIRRAHQPSLSVGGDIFNSFTLPDDRLCVYVGDVAGHGVGPAMVSTLLKALIDEVAREYAAAGPAVICNQIELRFRHYVSDPELYATLFLVILEADGRYRALSCGHPMPLLFDAEGQPLPAMDNRGGLPIGLSATPGITYERGDEVQGQLEPATLMGLYTDGLAEARHTRSGTLCGIDTLAAMLGITLQIPGVVDPARETLRRLGEAGYELAADDCTLLTISRWNPDTVRLVERIPPTHQAAAELATSVQNILIEEQWPEEAVGAAQLLVMEHACNVVDHGAGGADNHIELRARIHDDTLLLVFKDSGREWSFEERLAHARKQAIDSMRGRGLMMIRAIASHVAAVRQSGQNIYEYAIRRNFNPESAHKEDT